MPDGGADAGKALAVRATSADVERTYCGSDLEPYEPVFLEETEDGRRVPAGAFWNCGCLSVRVSEAELAGDAREWNDE